MERTASLSIFLIVSVLFKTSAGTCPTGMYVSEDNLCCLLCPKGTFLFKHCKESQGQSICKPCPPKTYMEHKNKETRCQPCASCTSSEEERSPCTQTEDTDCACKYGKYFHSSILFCMDCKECPEGEGVVKPCEGEEDTVCQPCREGTYSNTKNFNDPCKECSPCDPPYTVIKEPCNATQDTVCEPSYNLSTATPPTHSSAHLPTGQAGGKPSTAHPGDNKVYVTVLWVLVPIIVIIFFAVLFCYYKKCLCYRIEENDESRNSQDSGNHEEVECPCIPSTNAQTPAHSRSSGGLRGRHVHNPRQNGKDSDSQGSSGSLQGVSIGNGKKKTLVRDLPSHVYSNLGELLNPKGTNNWEKLAGKLGFNQTQVKNFQLYPRECAQNVLEDWGHGNDSTVDVLIKHLRDMKRDDCITELKPWDTASLTA